MNSEFDKFINNLFDFEKNNNLLDLIINDVKIWQYMRTKIFNTILEKDGKVFQHESKTKNIKTINYFNKIKLIFQLLFNSIFYNPFFSKKYKRIVILANRKVFYKNEYIDIYTHDLIEKENTLVIDSSMDETYLTKKYKRLSIIKLMMAFIRLFTKKESLNKDELEKISFLENEIKENFLVDLDLTFMFKKYTVTYKILYKLYYLLFKIVQPLEVVIVVSYGTAPLIKAAKDLGIEVIEVQHGIMGKYHFGYSYPYNKKLDYFPSKLYVMGEYFKNLKYLPIEKNSIVVHYYEYFNNKYNEVLNEGIKKKKRQILIISDAGDNGDLFLDFLLLNVKNLENYSFIYKLHPHEIYSEAYKSDKKLNRLMSYANFSVVSDSSILYKLIIESEYCISPKSTVIYEALAFESKVIIPKVYAWKDMEDLDSYVSFVELTELIDFQTIDNKNIVSLGYFIGSMKKNNDDR